MTRRKSDSKPQPKMVIRYFIRRVTDEGRLVRFTYFEYGHEGDYFNEWNGYESPDLAYQAIHEWWDQQEFKYQEGPFALIVKLVQEI